MSEWRTMTMFRLGEHREPGRGSAFHDVIHCQLFTDHVCLQRVSFIFVAYDAGLSPGFTYRTYNKHWILNQIFRRIYVDITMVFITQYWVRLHYTGNRRPHRLLSGEVCLFTGSVKTAGWAHLQATIHLSWLVSVTTANVLKNVRFLIPNIIRIVHLEGVGK